MLWIHFKITNCSFEIKNIVIIIGYVINFIACTQCGINVLCFRCVVIYTAAPNSGGRSAGKNIKGSAKCGENL
jgi:ABC-type transport system involved in Fe-S cluster assembly fused permease/ATPase subunit